MRQAFDPSFGLVVVPAEVYGPSGSMVLRLAVDTGASHTMMNVGLLVAVGYDPSLVPERVQVTTGSGVEYAPQVAVERIKALGSERVAFPVLGHTLPPSARIDGLLGLDYMRGQTLVVDLGGNTVSLD